MNCRAVLRGFVMGLALVSPAFAQESGPDVTLLTNVNVFDGENEALIENANVVVTGNAITAVSSEPLAVAGGRVIDGGGRTLIPGLIDATGTPCSTSRQSACCSTSISVT